MHFQYAFFEKKKYVTFVGTLLLDTLLNFRNLYFSLL